MYMRFYMNSFTPTAVVLPFVLHCHMERLMMGVSIRAFFSPCFCTCLVTGHGNIYERTMAERAPASIAIARQKVRGSIPAHRIDRYNGNRIQTPSPVLAWLLMSGSRSSKYTADSMESSGLGSTQVSTCPTRNPRNGKKRICPAGNIRPTVMCEE